MIPEPPPGQGPLDPSNAGRPAPAPTPPPAAPAAPQSAPPRPPGAMPPPPAGFGPPGRPPMPFPMMPMPYPPPPPRRAGGGFVRAIFLTLATTIFGISLLLNVWLLAVVGFRNAATSGGTSQQTLSKSGDPSQKVAVVKFDGVITSETATRFIALLDKVDDDRDVRALVIQIDSPGGEVTASDEVYDRIIRLKTERKLPVVVSMSSLCASGGYYFACAADRLVAQRTTLTGSIGVYFGMSDITGLAEKIGVKDRTIVADGGTYKISGSMWKPMTQDEETYFKSLVNDSLAIFKSVVTNGRGSKLTQSIDSVANGKIYTGTQALQLGLIDQIGYLDDAVALAAKDAGLNNPSAVKFEREPTLWDALSGAGPDEGARRRGVDRRPEAAHRRTIHGPPDPAQADVPLAGAVSSSGATRALRVPRLAYSLAVVR
ncbi:MAG: signal peptide peptidase SppA [Tepidisphaeraceae bacterium]